MGWKWKAPAMPSVVREAVSTVKPLYGGAASDLGKSIEKPTGLPTESLLGNPWAWAMQTVGNPLNAVNDITGGLSNALGVQPYINTGTGILQDIWDQFGRTPWHSATEGVWNPTKNNLEAIPDSWGMTNKGTPGGQGGGGGEAPPTLNEGNDPELAAQFQRMRKAARALGRAGTIKYKGAGNLGGSTSLGDPLALTGVGSSQA